MKASSNLDPHDPIVIDGNGGFTQQNGVTGGNGTASDPYVIEGWEISQSGAAVCWFIRPCGLTVRNTGAYFIVQNIYVHVHDYAVVFYNVTNGILQDSVVTDNGWGGLIVIGSNHITVSDNNITGNGYIYLRHIYPQPDITVWSSNNVVISGNFVSSMETYASNLAIAENRFVFRSGSVGLFLEYLNNATISHNQFSARNGWGVAIWISGETLLRISGNLFASSGIYFGPLSYSFGFTNLSITTDNLIDGRPIYYFKDCLDTSIENTSIGQLIVANCKNFQASNLQISDVPLGIVMSGVDNVVMSEIEFSDNGIAFSIHDSNHVTFSGNRLVRSGSWWFSWFDHVSDGVITRNKISSSAYGIGITHGQNLTVFENNFSDEIGLYLESSSNIHAYHNNFFQPATDFVGGQNSWDNGYPIGGNYWVNYTGVDNCSGPNQDICSVADGIGDTPYVEDSVTDRYPLMKPFAPLVAATAKYDPNVISQGSVGKYLTVSIQLPIGFNVSNVVLSSVRLNSTIALAADTRATVVSLNGAQVLIVKLKIAEVKTLFTMPGDYNLYLTGNIVNSVAFRPFAAATTIRVQSG